MNTCFFIGHREAPDGLLPCLTAEVERHITQFGVEEFVVGRYGRFDALAAAAVKNVKQRFPNVRLTQLLCYHPAERPVVLEPYFDGSFYPYLPGVPRRFEIVRANRWMVEHSDYLIAYSWHPASNSRSIVEYAKRLEKKGKIHVTMIPMFL